MIRTILIDDEENGLEMLKYCCNLNKDILEVIGQYTSPQKAVEEINGLNPDLLIMDIRMPSMSAFDILNALDNKDIEVIFATAHEHYAVTAFEYCAIDYLLKPIDEELFEKAITKVDEKIKNKTAHKKLETFLHNYNVPNALDKKILIPNQKGFSVVNIADVLYCESDNNYTTIHLSNKTKLLASKPILDFERVLTEPTFMRVHRSYIVNLNFIKEYQKGNGGVVILEDGTSIEVSRRKKEAFLNLLKGV